ncbi:hypothetical protein A2U01_0023372, partial [Trifolium medium]|nr:hypothetical protein [Trifolium medium]
MKTLSWNCRGLGSPRAVQALLRLTRLENPQLVFLMETRLKVDEMERIRSRCGFSSCLSVACSGSGRDRAGGLSLLWQDQVGHKWLCIGDLNDTLQADDKKGGLLRSQSQLGIGRQTVVACGLNDMGFEGYPFTWTNGRQGSENVQCRLDRALGTEDFLNRFSPWK